MPDPSCRGRHAPVVRPRGRLTEADLAADWVTQFTAWFDEAVASALTEPNAMVVATAAPDGRPSVRTVLLQGVRRARVRLPHQPPSRKGRELAANPHVALSSRGCRCSGRSS